MSASSLRILTLYRTQSRPENSGERGYSVLGSCSIRGNWAYERRDLTDMGLTDVSPLVDDRGTGTPTLRKRESLPVSLLACQWIYEDALARFSNP